MRMNRSMAGLGLAAALAAQASDLTITAFDGTGRLTFQEAPPAASYRVEWTTNLGSGAWSAQPPGLPAIPALGAGSQTVTVAVAHATCFYRVVAVGTNEPPAGLTNAFELGDEGWRMVSYPFRSHVADPAIAAAPFDPASGNPPGSVRVGDAYPETGVAAPAAYLGNKLAYYGGTLAYDIYLRYTDNANYPAVVLNGGTGSLYYDAASPPLDAWHRMTVPLSEAGWKISGTGAAATEAEFRAVLGSLTGIYLYTEWHTGVDDTNVDNVAMAPP